MTTAETVEMMGRPVRTSVQEPISAASLYRDQGMSGEPQQ
jgi:hypothetical protein